MATVYSLICWGGYAGSATWSRSGNQLTKTNHGIHSNGKIVYFSGGTLPTSSPQVDTTTPYYVKVISTTNIEIYTDSGLSSQVTFSATGSGWVLKSQAVVNPSTYFSFAGLSDLSRWNAGGGSYRIYDGLASWVSGRSGAVATAIEIAEIGEAFIEVTGSQLSVNTPSALVRMIAKVNGYRSPAYHSGSISVTTSYGYIFQFTSSSGTGISIVRPNSVIEGVTVKTSNTGNALLLGHYAVIASNVIVIGYSQASGIGVNIGYAGCALKTCFVANFSRGINAANYLTGCEISNCIVTKNTTGIYDSSTSNQYGFYINNISLGNVTTNWSSGISGFHLASNNAGLTGEPWASSGATSIVMATSDFASYGTSSLAQSDDFRPAASGSPQVDSGIPFYGAEDYDIADGERPNYNNGGSEVVDLGCYEYDHGYGDHPQTQDVTVSGFAASSRIKIAKQSDGTEIYNSTSPSWPQTTSFSTSTPVYIYIRKGSATTYYHPLKLSATIDPVAGLTYDATGLQQEDIAAHDYSATAVASDWTFNSGTGAIAHASGTTRYSVQDLYSWHQDYYDDSSTVDDNPLMNGVTSTIFTLLNGGTITDGDLEDLKGGSIEFENGDLWSNLWTTNTMAAAHDVYVVQGSSKYTSFWPSGPIDVLLQVSDAGTLRSSGLVDVYARPYGYTYAYYQADLSGGGRTVAPIATLVDVTCQAIAPSGYTDVTYTFGSTSKDFGDVHGSQTYYCVIDCNNRPLSQVFARTQYDCRDVSTTTLNSIPGWRYQSAHTGYTANTQAPFGMYSGGIWTVAKGVWLNNVPSGDLINYILTDDAGHTHQNTVALNQSVTVSGLTVGSRVQIYDTTNSAELYNGIASTSSVNWEDPSSPVGDRAIRVRIAYVSGASAKNFIEANIGTCGTSSTTKDVTYLASQTNDSVYNANAVDGSTVTGVTFTDSSVDVMNIDISAGVDLPDLYAAWVYYAFTETGIATDIDYIQAVDTANYVYSNLVWKNVTSPSVPLKISGGYAWDSITLDPMDLIDTTGGTIFLAPPHVVSKVVTVTGGNVITGSVSDLPSAAETTAAIFAQAQVTPIPAECSGSGGSTGLTLEEFVALK